MKAAVISFTEKGGRWNREITGRLRAEEVDSTGYGFYKYAGEGLTPFSHVKDLTEGLFASSDLLLFIGATGIALRAVAPFFRGKAKDPAVLVMDECGIHVISLLSGHLGGANEWCRRIALLTGAEPVITTATDLNGVFAVDVFARETVWQCGTRRLSVRYPEGSLTGKPWGFTAMSHGKGSFRPCWFR